MHFVTKVTSIRNVDSKCYSNYKEPKKQKDFLIGYSSFISHEWFIGASLSPATSLVRSSHIQTTMKKVNNFHISVVGKFRVYKLCEKASNLYFIDTP